MSRTQTGDIKIINKWLLRFAHLPNRPKEAIFRLVWSPEETEKRYGTFNDFTESGLFIRQFTGVRELRKYGYLEPSWVLERWIPPSLGVVSQELPLFSTEGSYEPFFVFRSKNGEFLQPSIKVVEFIVSSILHIDKSTPAEEQDRAARLEDAEVAHFMEAIDTSPVQNALHMKEAVGYTKEISHVS